MYITMWLKWDFKFVTVIHFFYPNSTKQVKHKMYGNFYPIKHLTKAYKIAEGKKHLALKQSNKNKKKIYLAGSCCFKNF